MSIRKPLSADALICGTSIRLIAMETTRSKWTTAFIGSRPGRYLIVEMPKVAGGPVKLDEGTRWSANFISQGAVYSFQTEVIGYTYRLVPLLFLSYPQEVEVANLRTEKRYPVNIPLVSTLVDGPPVAPGGGSESNPTPELPPGPLKALVVDISESGCLIACSFPLPLDATIESVFHLPKEEPIEGVKASVRTCRGQAGSYFIGLAYSFANTPEIAGRLSDIISNIENMPLRL